MSETVEQLTLLQQLRSKRTDAVNAASALIEARTKARDEFEARKADDITDEARSTFTAEEEAFASDFAKREDEIKNLDRRVAEQEMLDQRRSLAAGASANDARVTGEPKTYRQDNGTELSYYRDLALSKPGIAQSMGGGNVEAAQERLNRHAVDVGEYLKRKIAERERRAHEQVDRAEREFHTSNGMQARGFDSSPFEQRVNPNRLPGQGGYFVPPLWLIEDNYIPALRAGAVAAGLVRHMDLPEGTDSINVPKITQGSVVGYQNVDGAPVPEQDIQDSFVQANVKTIAGQQDVAIQLLEQSPGQVIDQVITEDLMADYVRFRDRQIIIGSGANSAALNGGQMLGVYPGVNWGANTVTWNSASPAGPAFNQVLGAMASRTANTRFNLEGFKFLLSPSRWFWFATALDGTVAGTGAGTGPGLTGRPLVNSPDVGFNISARYDGLVPEGLVGTSQFGPEIYVSANVPHTPINAADSYAADNGTGGLVNNPAVGAGNDIAIGAKWDDIWMFEGQMRTRVLNEVLSGTLQVRFQLFNYCAMLVRYGQSITIASGTGFSQPKSPIDPSIVY